MADAVSRAPDTTSMRWISAPSAWAAQTATGRARSANGEPSTGTTTRPMSTGSTGPWSVRSAGTACSLVRLERPATATDARTGNTAAGALAPPTGGPPTAPLQGQHGGGRALALPPWPAARPDYDGRPALAGAIGRPEQERHIRSIHRGAHRPTEARHASATDRRSVCDWTVSRRARTTSDATVDVADGALRLSGGSDDEGGRNAHR
jgi:hypothetical protein